MTKPREYDAEPVLPDVPFESCPIRASVGVLGRKWALLVLRDVAFFKNVTFSEIMRSNLGLTPRVLTMRLRELRKEELIERVVNLERHRDIRYRLTPKGKDIVPILAAFIQYGIRHHADRVFKDGKPRAMAQVFPGQQDVMLGRLQPYADDATQEVEGRGHPPRAGGVGVNAWTRPISKGSTRRGT